MADLPAVRRLGQQLNDDVDLLLINIHQQPGRTLTDRYNFQYSPTYILFDGSGEEVWRGNRRPSEADILAELAVEP